METRKINELRPHPLNAEIYGDGCDADLRDSVKAKGILTPVLITSQYAEIGANIIISGHRRFNAAQMAQLAEVPVVVSNLQTSADIEEAVIIANKQRHKTNEQIGREFQKLIAIEETRAKARQIEHGNTAPGREKTLVEPVPQVIIPTVKTSIKRMSGGNGNGRAREIVGEKIGTSGKHAERAAKVVEVIDTLQKQGQSEQAQEIRQTLNRSVKAAYEEVKPVIEEKKAAAAPPLLLTSDQNPVKKSTFNATNDNIEWAKWSWNPVTGCKHGCQYCYARDIANRFTGHFNPEFHEDRLNAPFYTKVPESRKNEPGIRNVFVCSMADLFGEWVPDEWIQKVMEQVRRAPQWNFLFLTKNPERYLTVDFPANCWVGASADTQARTTRALTVFAKLATEGRKPTVTFLSSEPLSEAVSIGNATGLDWLIIGGRSKTTGMEAGQPRWEWVETLLFEARAASVSVYFKPNLTVQPKEYPER